MCLDKKTDKRMVCRFFINKCQIILTFLLCTLSSKQNIFAVLA